MVMGFIEKLKLLLKVRQPVTDLINEVKSIKAGYKTIPFWITVIGTVLSVIVATVLTAFYNILRGATKTDVTDVKPIFQTTEFWMGVFAELQNAILALQAGGINPKWLALSALVIGAAMSCGQNLASQSPNVSANPVVPPAQ